MHVAVPVPAIPGVVLRVGKAGQGRGATRLEDLGANLLQWIGFQGEFTIYSPIFYVYFILFLSNLQCLGAIVIFFFQLVALTQATLDDKTDKLCLTNGEGDKTLRYSWSSTGHRYVSG